MYYSIYFCKATTNSPSIVAFQVSKLCKAYQLKSKKGLVKLKMQEETLRRIYLYVKSSDCYD